MGVLNFIKRAFVGDQTTGRLSFQQYQSYARAGVNGDAGFTVKGQVNATYPAGIAPGPTHRLIDPLQTGNPSVTLELFPLTNDVGRTI
jgi:hypothetical protein